MTLDEMIAWLGERSALYNRFANQTEREGVAFMYGVDIPRCIAEDREHAATLLTIENALRAYKQAQEDDEQRQMDAWGDNLDRGL